MNRELQTAFNMASEQAKGLPPVTWADYKERGEPATEWETVAGLSSCVRIRREMGVLARNKHDDDHEAPPEEEARYTFGMDVVRIVFDDLEPSSVQAIADSAPWPKKWIHGASSDHLNQAGEGELLIDFHHAGRKWEYMPVVKASCKCPYCQDQFATDEGQCEVELYGRVLTPAARQILAKEATSLVDMEEARAGFDACLRNITGETK